MDEMLRRCASRRVVMVHGLAARQEDVWAALDTFEPQVVVHGSGRGADGYADQWARRNRVARLWLDPRSKGYDPAALARHGAVMLRMLDTLADRGATVALIAFGHDAATDELVRRARGLNIPVVERGRVAVPGSIIARL